LLFKARSFYVNQDKPELPADYQELLKDWPKPEAFFIFLGNQIKGMPEAFFICLKLWKFKIESKKKTDLFRSQLN
jgi:hypothetical protein